MQQSVRVFTDKPREKNLEGGERRKRRKNKEEEKKEEKEKERIGNKSHCKS